MAEKHTQLQPSPLIATEARTDDDQLDYYFDVLNEVERRPPEAQNEPQARTDINQEIARHQQLENNDFEQNISLKRKTLNRLFWFLALETTVIFMLAIFQAVGWPRRFHLEEWSFKLLITATIAQITGMLYVAVRYLFPKNDRHHE